MTKQHKVAFPLILLGTSLFLSACGGGSVTITPEPDPTPTTVNVISGVLTPVKVGMIASQRLNKSTAVSANGNFDLGLPDAQTMTTDSKYKGDLSDISSFFATCKGGTMSFPAGLQFTNIAGMFVDNQNPEYIDYSNYSGGVLSYKSWWFVNMDATITADTDCLVGKIKANMNLKKGWNIVNYVDTYANNTVTSQLSLGTQTNARMTWRPKPTTNVAQSLRPQSNSVRDNPWGVIR